VNGAQTILEVYPQPARTSLVTTLASNMASTDTTATLTSAALTLPFGFVSIGSEIMAYATFNSTTGVLTGLIRGLGGTGTIAHTAGETAVECNIAWMGKRQSSVKYSPGQSLTVLPIVSGWDQLLVQYIAGRAKIVEHDMQSMAQFNQDMEKQIKAWALTNKGIVKRRQVGGPSGPVVYFPDISGGVLINGLIPVFYVVELLNSRYHFFGGDPWKHILFTVCSILGTIGFATWDKLKTQGSETTLTDVLIPEQGKLKSGHGFWNYALSIFGQCSKLLKSAMKVRGRSGNNSGLPTMAGSKICSTQESEEHPCPHGFLKFTLPSEKNLGEESVPRCQQSWSNLGNTERQAGGN
jgi:hypothetical protein